MAMEAEADSLNQLTTDDLEGKVQIVSFSLPLIISVSCLLHKWITPDIFIVVCTT